MSQPQPAWPARPEWWWRVYPGARLYITSIATHHRAQALRHFASIRCLPATLSHTAIAISRRLTN